MCLRLVSKIVSVSFREVATGREQEGLGTRRNSRIPARISATGLEILHKRKCAEKGWEVCEMYLYRISCRRGVPQDRIERKEEMGAIRSIP